MKTLKDYIDNYSNGIITRADTILLSPDEFIKAEEDNNLHEFIIYAKYVNHVYKITTNKNGLVIGFEKVVNENDY